MNDFTKEELKEILYCVTHYQSCKWSSDFLIQIEDKLQSMINDYCEHKNSIGIHKWKTCNDCGQPFV